MSYKQDIEDARYHYEHLKEIVEDAIIRGEKAQEFYNKWGGHNWDEVCELFDLNYFNICATVIFNPKNYQILRLTHGVEIYGKDENGSEIRIEDDFNMAN